MNKNLSPRLELDPVLQERACAFVRDAFEEMNRRCTQFAAELKEFNERRRPCA